MATPPTQSDFDTPIPGEYFDARGRFFGPQIRRPLDLTPEQVKLPSLDGLTDYLDDLPEAERIAALNKISQAYGIQKPWRELRADTESYVSRMTGLPPGSPAFKAEVERLISPEVGGVPTARRNARAAQRRYQQIAAQDGNPNQQFVRISEGDDRTCAGCGALEGTEGTMDEQRSVGLPGHQECGQNCRCTLQPVETVGAAQGENLIFGAVAAGILSELI